MEFSLFYFSSIEDGVNRDKYRLVIEGTKFADQSGFTAVWTPERHFQPFGGLFPNPSMMASALAMVTNRIQLRAGSVVLPLHHPLRVAEEWSVVDNLTGGGRIGLAMASGWHPDDFVFSSEPYSTRKEELYRRIEVFRSAWRGEAVTIRDGLGKERQVHVYPRPLHDVVPIWITVVKDPESYRRAAQIGANVLTNLAAQSVEELAQNISVYRTAREKAGYDPMGGVVTLLLHTYLGSDVQTVREKVRTPLRDYLRSTVGVAAALGKSFGNQRDMSRVPSGILEELLDLAFRKYVTSSALIGTPESCMQLVDRLKGIGVTEIGSLIDFGLGVDDVLAGLPYLNRLRERYAGVAAD